MSSDFSDNDDAGSGMSAPSDNDADLTTILSFLLRSRQVRLVRTGGTGPLEVSLSGTNLDEDDSDDDESPRDYWRMQHSPPSPQSEAEPDATKMNQSPIKGMTEKNVGKLNKSSENIINKLHRREGLFTPRMCRNNFSLADKVQCNNNYLPNTFQTVARYRAKAFCGTYTQDGDTFMTACQDQYIRLYDTSCGQVKLFREIPAQNVAWSIIDTSFSPDQQYIIYSSWSEYIHLCNVHGDHDTHMALDLDPTESNFCALSISFSPDSKEIIASSNDQCIYIYDREKDERTLRFYAHDDDVNTVKFVDSFANTFISAGDDGICKVWDRRQFQFSVTPGLPCARAKPVGLFAGHTDGITHLSVHSNGLFFISNSKDQSIKLWDMRKFSSEETLKEARKIVGNQHWDYRWESVPRRFQRAQLIPGDVSLMTYRGHSVLNTLLRAKFSPAFSTGEQFIYTGCASGHIIIYDVLTGKIVTKLKGAHRKCVRDVSWHPFENTIMSSSWDSTVAKWNYCHLAAVDTPDELKDEISGKFYDRKRGCGRQTVTSLETNIFE